MSKKKCDWCKKRKKTEKGYNLGKFEGSNKEWFICNKCNIKHDIL